MKDVHTQDVYMHTVLGVGVGGKKGSYGHLLINFN